MNDNFSPKPTSSDCNGIIHHMAVKGVELFNSGQYWKAHEAFEEAWLDETGEVRHLYRGILQVGVTYLHVERRNYYGALKVYQRSKHWLAPFTDVCRGINIGKLKNDLEDVIAEVRRLGPNQLDKFDRSLLKPVHYEANKIG
jgi:predicted metal-dependent hydrolase